MKGDSKFKVFILITCECFFLPSFAQQFQDHNASYQYYIGETVGNYAEAETACKSMNRTLALVNTEDIRDALLDVIGNPKKFPYSFYIGLRRTNTRCDQFEWIDGTPSLAGFVDWADGHPNMKIKNGCVVMRLKKKMDSTYKWRNVPCNSRSRFICQRLYPDHNAVTTSFDGLVPATPKEMLSTIDTYQLFSSTTLIGLLLALGITFVCCAGIILALVVRMRKLKNTIKKLNAVKKSEPSSVPLTELTTGGHLQPSTTTDINSQMKINDATDPKSDYAIIVDAPSESCYVNMKIKNPANDYDL